MANAVLQRLWYAGFHFSKNLAADLKPIGDDPIGIGVRSLPIGFGIIFGAAFALMLIPVVKGRTRPLMIFSCALMTAGK